MADHEATAPTTTSLEIVTRAAFGRAWTDLEPKIIAGLTGGGIITLATYIGGLFSIDLAGWQVAAIAALGSALAGYLKRSTIKVPTLADSSAAANTAAGAPAVIDATPTDDEPDLSDFDKPTTSDE